MLGWYRHTMVWLLAGMIICSYGITALIVWYVHTLVYLRLSGTILELFVFVCWVFGGPP